ncbi:HlyD family secretion protein [Sphingomonas sp. CARO-RG-8B-R24-01]|uniref:HlyD family secretion protein n=1 Tax=Sphingomonas sp. CARO-RG-8B-R24-01 TaxID=2914831 RepID=UPI001F5AF344|nr:HlyD family secretion protein [Sphingomonas sp. CARO-RG-8B-R24-01]
MTAPAAKPAAKPAPNPDAPPSRRARILLFVGLAIVVVIVAIGLWLASRPAPEQIQGMVEADSVNVATKALARVDRLLVDEGARVRAGQVLATLSSPELGNAERQAQGVLDSARAVSAVAQAGARSEDVGSLRAIWLAAQAAADLGATSSRRADTLYAEGVIAAQRRDEAHAARDSSRRSAEAARLQYHKALAGTRSEEKQAAAAQVRIAQAGLATAQALVGETRLVSPIAGEVSRKLLQPGEIVSPVLPAYQVIDIDHPWVEITVRESQYAGLRQGKTLVGHVPALARDVAFRVSHIAPEAAFATVRATRQSTGYDVRAFTVKLKPAGRTTDLRPGMSVLFDWAR